MSCCTKIRIHSVLLLLVAAIVITSPFSYGSSTNKQKVTLQLFWQHQFEFAGFYAAIQQGFFEKHGIEVELKESGATDNYIEDVINGEAQFGLGGTRLIEDYHRGVDIKLLASYFKHSPITIITQPEVTSLKELEGQIVLGNESQLKQGSIREMLNLHGVDINRINTKVETNALELFKDKKTVAILSYSTDAPFDLIKSNTPFRQYDPSQFGIISQDMNLFTTGVFAKENPKLVNEFVKAANKGWKYAVEHPDEVIALIKSEYNSQNKSIEALQFEAKETIKLMLPDIYPVGSLQKNKLELISEKLLANQVISNIRDIDDLIFNQQQKSKINEHLFSLLTPSEKQYLESHPVLKVQSDGNYPPFNYVIDDKPLGYSIDLINLMSSMLGVKFEFIKGESWAEYMEMLKRKDLDVLINIINIKNRQNFASFTSPYAEMVTYAVTRKSSDDLIISKNSLIGKRVAITEGYAINELLKKALPESIFISVQDTAQALNFISSNQVDVYIEVGAVLDYYISKNAMSDLQIVPVSAELEVVNQKFSIATNLNNPTLLNILQKTMNVIPDIEQIRLKRKWFGENTIKTEKRISFTQAEKIFISSSSSLTLCRTKGIKGIIQLIDIITRNTELKIKLSRPLSWDASLKALLNNQCDILLTASPSFERKKVMNFSPTYNQERFAITTQKKQVAVNNLFAQLDKTFAIIKSLNVKELLIEEYPSIKLIEVIEPHKGLELVQQGKVFGFIYPESFTSNLLKNNNYSDVKIGGYLRAKFDDIQTIATRKQDKILHSILSKAVTFTDKAELRKYMQPELIPQENNQINLSLKEQTFLKNNEVIWCITSYRNWMEFIPFLTSKVNMKLAKTKVLSWNEALAALAAGECDLLPEVTPTEIRQKVMNFTPTIHQEERVIVTTEEQNFISNIEDYPDKIFTIRNGDLLVDQLKEAYPKMKLQLVEYDIDGIQLVQQKQAFAYIGSISVMSRTINQFGIKNLKISGSLPDKFMDNWTIATKKENKVLGNILTKIILSMDKKEIRKELFGDFTVKYEQGFDHSLFWQLISIATVILTIIIFWNRRLALLNLQLSLSKKSAEEAQQKVEEKNSEILATQQHLVQSEKMASLGTLTAGVAHEINNPTNFTYAAVYMMQNEIISIKSFLKQLAGGENANEEVIRSFDKKFKKLVELTQTASEGTTRIKTIVENLRTFARIDNEKQEESNITDLIKATIHLVQTQFDHISIETKLSYSPVLLCFPSKLNQVFMNIIVNACQSIETRRITNNELNPEFHGLITISTVKKNNDIVISISDNGCGMDALTQQKMCEPFFTTKDVGSGTGLGMAISFGIIDEHGGTLNVSSTVNEGATVSIYLPIDYKQPEQK